MKNRTRYTFIAALLTLAVCIACLLPGCDKNDSVPEPSSEPTAAAPTDAPTPAPTDAPEETPAPTAEPTPVPTPEPTPEEPAITPPAATANAASGTDIHLHEIEPSTVSDLILP